MANIYRTVSLASGAFALIGSLVACGGSSDGSTAGPDASVSSSPTAAPTASAGGPEPVFISLEPADAKEAERKLEGQPGVDHTRYAKGPERFWVYYTADVTKEQRKHVRRVIYSVLGS